MRGAAAVLTGALLAGCSQGDPAPQAGSSQDSAAAVRAAYGTYRQALLNRDGAQAAEQVSTQSVAQYESWRQLAVTATPAQLAGRRLIDAITVVILRLSFTAWQLRAVDARQLFAQSVHKGLVGEVNLRQSSLGEVTLVGADRATGTYQVDGSPTGIKLDFALQEGRWRYDLTSALASSELDLQQTRSSSGLSARSFVERVLDRRYRADDVKTAYQTPTG